MGVLLPELTICIKGAGEMASAVACRLFNANLTRIVMLETAQPLAVRRRVAFSEAVYQRRHQVEGVTAGLVDSVEDIRSVWQRRELVVRVDPDWRSLDQIRFDVVIDAVLAKANLGTTLQDASLVIGLGPGFDAGRDVHAVIETNRGHNLGRIITHGCADADTGVPGDIGGVTRDRVLRAPVAGAFSTPLRIGAKVTKGQALGSVAGQPVHAAIDGVLRGLLRSGTRVPARAKLGDIDPRAEPAYCGTVSDKARAIGGAVLEVVLRYFNQ